MLTPTSSIQGKTPFTESAELFAGLTEEAAVKVAMLAGDIVLIVDSAGEITDGSAGTNEFPDLGEWIGRDWVDTVTVESRPKIMEMLAAMRKGQTQHWRQVTHVGAHGNVPVRYALVPVEDGEKAIALGRDEREMAVAQQRLLQAQQSLERDYLRLRQLETRYRILFEQSSEPVLILDASTHVVREANPAAHRLLSAKEGALSGKRIFSYFTKGHREQLIAFLGSALVTDSAPPLKVDTAKGSHHLTLTASGFRQRGQTLILVRMFTDERLLGADESSTLDVVDQMPDAFVLTDAEGEVVLANQAFVELVGAAGVEQLRGNHLSDWVGRPGIDLDLIEGQLSKHHVARNVSTVIGASESFEGEPVELSAIRLGDEEQRTGYIVRPTARRLRDLPPSSNDLPRSVEQLTELVGRMSLKDIVRESTDLIERLCIEAALTYTSDNRASAAEILGLSRQSLYSKLHRYGLGNLSEETD